MQLGGITLPDMKWVERLDSFGVEAVIKQTRGGKIWVWEGSVSGRKITLQGGDSDCWVSYAQFKQVKALAEVKGVQYQLVLGDLDVMVRFRNEDAPAVSAVTVVDFYPIDDEDYVAGVTVKLMVV